MADRPMIDINKILLCKHIFDSIPDKDRTMLHLICRECFIAADVQIEKYYQKADEDK